MHNQATILGETHSYELRKQPDSVGIVKRDVVYDGQTLGTVYCRGQQRNGYEIEGREDVAIGHSQSGLAQFLIVEYLLKKLLKKMATSISEASTNTQTEEKKENVNA